MDRLQLGLDEQSYREHLKAELKAVGRGADADLLKHGCSRQFSHRIQALAYLPTHAQFKLHLEWASLPSNAKIRERQLYLLGTEDRGQGLADYYARVIGYVPEHRTESALVLLPGNGDIATLQSHVRLLTDRCTKDTDAYASKLAQRLLQAKEEKKPQEAKGYDPSFQLRRAMFNTRLMHALREHGYNERSIRPYLSHGKDPAIHLHAPSEAAEIFSSYQWSGQYEIDTVNDCLAALPPSVAEPLAREFWRTYKHPKSGSRVLYGSLQSEQIRAEAAEEGECRYRRASVGMMLRSIGVRDHEYKSDTPPNKLASFLAEIGMKNDLNSVSSVWKRLQKSRAQFHEFLYLSEALKRKPT